ncbi:hypothetical protein AN958_10046 [Leucoagaricus sp. SymC.cos]|nr:hypothetical protein AN958_10046 [Leucoagaricus sp. SymC.cos]
MGVKLIIHIWVHDISQPDLLSVHGMPKDWRELKEIFKGTMEMDGVSLLLTKRENFSLEEGIKEELKIRRALMEDVEKGLIFEHLLARDQADAWSVLEEVIELSTPGLDGKRDIEKRVERTEMSDERLAMLVSLLQREIDELCTELDKSAEGRKLHKEVQKYFANHQARIDPLLAQIDDEHEIGRKKKEAQATVEQEHLLFRKTMWSFFEVIEKLEPNVSIGPHLQSFYGFNAVSCSSLQLKL